MNTIGGNKVGNTINLIINGKTHSRKYSDGAEAKEMFNAVLTAMKENSDENFDRVLFLLNKTKFVLKGDFLYFDSDTEKYYIKGLNKSIPNLLGTTIDEFIEEGYPIESLKNFGTLLMSNPDKNVRSELFKFIQTHDFSITQKGYMVVYKAVGHKKLIENDIPTFIGRAYVTAKKYKKSPKQYCIYQRADGENAMTYEKTYKRWIANGKADDNSLTYLGNLSKLYDDIADVDGDKTIFTDKYTHTMSIELGNPVQMDRAECDNNSQRECSYGLHVGATKYVEAFGNSEDTILLCLINPAHVVAVPNYDNSKLRVSEYYPYGIVTRNANGKINKVNESYFESDYAVFEKEQLEVAIEDAGDDNTPEVQAMKIRVLNLVG